ncbi:MAG: NAD(P)-dependent oxidoreductase [Spirochaetales bacterium]|nr:NAD(P)-dependent oxidoreductase [Spirochaetales bacterium]
MKNVLISGANGFIGRNLIQRLVSDNIHIYALVLPEEKLSEIFHNSEVTVIKCDLEKDDSKEIPIPENIDVFYHLAWIGVNPESRRSFLEQERNLYVLHNVLNIADIKHVKRIVLPGSTSEYLFSGGLINKDSLPTPKDAYGSVKVAIRYLAQQFAVDKGISFVYAVMSGIYSDQRKDSNVITYTIDSLLKRKKPSLTKLEQLWDYIYIDDAIEALRLVGEKGRNGMIYAIGHGDNWSLSNYVRIIHEKIDPTLPLGIGEMPYSSSIMPSSCIDLTDIKQDTGFVPKVSFEEGISRVIKKMQQECGLSE